MKNFPRTKRFALIAMGLLAAFLIQACALFIRIHDHKFVLSITFPQEIKNVPHFEAVLDGLHKPGVSYDFDLVSHRGERKHYHFDSGVAIKTDRVIITELAKSLSKEQLTPIGSSLTHRLYTTDAKDIAAVLNEIKK